MHRIDHSTAVAALPAPAALGTPGYFTQGDPVNGVPATIVTKDWANALQEEVAAVVLAAGLTLDKANNAQLLTAITAMIAGAAQPDASETVKGILRLATDALALGRTDDTTAITPAALGFAERPVKTASAQFVRATNEILMNGIVTGLGLEVGDVIQITGSASNNITMTVEVITDVNDINVNYEHRNGAGPLSLTDETVVCTIKRIAKWYNAPIGLGQAWVDVTASRVMNTSYLNSTNRSIAVVCGNYGGAAARDAIIYKGGGSAVNADAYSRSSSTNGASVAAFATISASESYAMNSPIGTIYVKERR